MRCLCVSGGGFQALYGVLLLETLEREGGPLRDGFDTFCGTSAGAITAAAAAFGVPMGELKLGFVERGARAFTRKRSSWAADIVRRLSEPRYDPQPLRMLVREICGDAVMADVPSLLVTATRLHDGAAVLFSGLTHPDVKVEDAVCASAAAPVMFPAVMVDGALHADGAIFANAPDLLAMAHVMRFHGGLDHMLSIGSMNASPPMGEPASPAMGALHWLRGNRIFRTMIGSQADMTERVARAAMRDLYTRIDADPAFPLRDDVGLDKADVKAVRAASVAAAGSEPLIRAWAERFMPGPEDEPEDGSSPAP